MELTERKKKVLRAIVDLYIRTATFSTILSTRCIFSSMALLMDLVSSMLRR